MTTYVLAGGCFWCLDAVFRKLRGVQNSICGYAGGTTEEADYYQVMSGKTGHAEAVQVTFDERVLPSDVLLDIFFTIHDPTSLNRQGADTGPQYRSAMFFANNHEEKIFESAIERAQPNYNKPIVTTLEPLDAFFPAEAEHQDYYSQNPFNPYCPIVITPKVRKARQQYTMYFKES